MISFFFCRPKENLSEITIAKQKLQRARSLFDSATDASFEYANAELTAALEYMDYVLRKDHSTGEGCEWKSA